MHREIVKDGHQEPPNDEDQEHEVEGHEEEERKAESEGKQEENRGKKQQVRDLRVGNFVGSTKTLGERASSAPWAPTSPRRLVA